MSDKTFRPWDPDQQILFPPSISDFVPKGHLAHFIRDVVRNDLDLSAIFARYTERRGQPPCHPALDGTKMKANASKHAAMSYARMKKREPELAQLVAEWMEAARSADEEEDQEHGSDRRGDELPEHIREKLKKLLQADG